MWGGMTKTKVGLLIAAVVALGTAGAMGSSEKAFECTRRSGDWGLFKKQADGPELIACFGGMNKSQDDELLCRAALKYGDVGPGYYYWSVFR
jgi:hypothetical protein